MSKFDFPRSRCRHPPRDRAEIDYASTESHTRGISPGGKVAIAPFSFLFFSPFLLSRFILSLDSRESEGGEQESWIPASRGKERKGRRWASCSFRRGQGDEIRFWNGEQRWIIMVLRFLKVLNIWSSNGLLRVIKRIILEYVNESYVSLWILIV